MNPAQQELYHEVKEHTPFDFPYNTYLCSIPLDFISIKTHWHEEIEIIVIKKGEGTIYVDLTPYSVYAGDIVFITSGQLHSIEQKGTAIMEYENILFKPNLLKSSGQDYCNDAFIQLLFSGKTKFSPVMNHSCPYQSELFGLIDKIDALCDSQPYGYQLAVKGYLFQFFYVILTHCEETNQKYTNQKSVQKIKQILTYLAEHYQHSITIEEIAGHCFYSKSYFMKFFKDTMGMSFIHYLNDYRLDIAAKLLLQTTDNILDIAIRCGFDNLSYFNRLFKKKYGISPGKYRE